VAFCCILATSWNGAAQVVYGGEQYDIGSNFSNGVFTVPTGGAGVYVRKTPAAKSSSGSTGGGRVSVADAQAKLTSVLGDAGQEVDEAIISKLTGKAANYFASIVENLNN